MSEDLKYSQASMHEGKSDRNNQYLHPVSKGKGLSGGETHTGSEGCCEAVPTVNYSIVALSETRMMMFLAFSSLPCVMDEVKSTSLLMNSSVMKYFLL